MKQYSFILIGAGGRGTAQRIAEYCEERELPYAIVPQQMLDGEM